MGLGGMTAIGETAKQLQMVARSLTSKIYMESTQKGRLIWHRGMVLLA